MIHIYAVAEGELNVHNRCKQFPPWHPCRDRKQRRAWKRTHFSTPQAWKLLHATCRVSPELESRSSTLPPPPLEKIDEGETETKSNQNRFITRGKKGKHEEEKKSY